MISVYKNIFLFGIPIVNIAKKDFILLINEIIGLAIKRREIYFINANNYVEAYYSPKYLRILKKADYVFGDGIGIRMATLIFGEKLIDNINGTDLFIPLCEYCCDKKISLFLLGGKSGVTDKMYATLMQKYPSLIIAGMHHGYFDIQIETENIIKEINNAKPNILLVGFGTPLQEYWIEEHLNMIDCNIAIGVGGLFDFYSGNIKRAPKMFRSVGLEWLFRLLQEPRRLWKRYLLGIPKFILIILRQKMIVWLKK